MTCRCWQSHRFPCVARCQCLQNVMRRNSGENHMKNPHQLCHENSGCSRIVRVNILLTVFFSISLRTSVSCVFPPLFVRPFVHPSLYPFSGVSLPECERVSVRACVRACLLACLPACLPVWTHKVWVHLAATPDPRQVLRSTFCVLFCVLCLQWIMASVSRFVLVGCFGIQKLWFQPQIFGLGRHPGSA